MWEWITTEISADYLTAIGTFAIAVATLILAVATFCLASAASGWKSQWQADAEKDLAQRLLAAWTEFWPRYLYFHAELLHLVDIVKDSNDISIEERQDVIIKFWLVGDEMTKPLFNFNSLFLESKIICGHSFEDPDFDTIHEFVSFGRDLGQELQENTDIDETKRDELLKRFEGFGAEGGQADDPLLFEAKFYNFIIESYSIHKPQSKLSWLSKLKLWPSKNKMV